MVKNRWKGWLYMYDINEIKNFYSTHVNCKQPFVDPPLIHVIKHQKMNYIEDRKSLNHTITQKWILDHRNDLSDKLRTNTINFFVNLMPSSTGNKSYLKMWTTYDTCKDIIKDKGFTKRFVRMWDASFQPSDSIYLAYIANNFLPPKKLSCGLTNDQYALSILLNFIGRSAIRNGKEIWIYLPSFRMRRLLEQWIDENTTSPKEK